MKFQKACCLLFFLLSFAACAYAQDNEQENVEKQISDNSFLIEEAYNQDADTMQSDTAINYRYQLSGMNDADRVSAI